jgi:hypothetical protein
VVLSAFLHALSANVCCHRLQLRPLRLTDSNPAAGKASGCETTRWMLCVFAPLIALWLAGRAWPAHARPLRALLQSCSIVSDASSINEAILATPDVAAFCLPGPSTCVDPPTICHCPKLSKRCGSDAFCGARRAPKPRARPPPRFAQYNRFYPRKRCELVVQPR